MVTSFGPANHVGIIDLTLKVSKGVLRRKERSYVMSLGATEIISRTKVEEVRFSRTKKKLESTENVKPSYNKTSY